MISIDFRYNYVWKTCGLHDCWTEIELEKEKKYNFSLSCVPGIA